MSVIIHVGEWSQRVLVSEYPQSFVHDWYQDGRVEGEDELRVDTMTFLPEQWEKLTLLRDLETEENIDRIVQGIRRMNNVPLTQYPSRHSFSQERIMKSIYYSDVKESLRAMGGRSGDNWTLFVTLDENDDPLERYHINKKRGEVLRSREISYVPHCVGRRERTLMSTHQLIMASVRLEHLQEASDVITGILHNGNSLLEGNYYFDWAYIMWMDIVLLCEKVGVQIERVPDVLVYAGLRTFDQLTVTDTFRVEYASTLRECISGPSTPLLYWRIMNEYEEDENPYNFGLGALTEGFSGTWPVGRRLINRYAAIVNHLSSLAVQMSIYKEHEKEMHYKVYTTYMEETAQYMRDRLGLLAMAKIYLVLLYHSRNTVQTTNRVQRFLQALTEVFTREGRTGKVSDYCRRLLSAYDFPRVRRLLEEGDPGRLLMTKVPMRLERREEVSCAIL